MPTGTIYLPVILERLGAVSSPILDPIIIMIHVIRNDLNSSLNRRKYVWSEGDVVNVRISILCKLCQVDGSVETASPLC
jgi:hypothetical protein